ncbi:DNA repair protein RecN [Salibacter halophilus]|uniref:DNA repair protein RecN n=1 Tax=Salibacter halophilus TaxID=1803916 RepID=UPI001478A419|nr:DNA repair protein RecN [Salibacter halophilus]
MLSHLKISNYAIIEELDVSFENGFVVLTGETGAGKSIILGALGLVLGERADLSVLNVKEQKAIIEAEFDIKNYGLKPFFELHNLDFEPLTIVRREITPSGKSRAFVNDTPVKLNVVKELSSRLIDVHAQHQTLSIQQSDFQLDLVDRFAGISDKVRDYESVYNGWKQDLTKLNELQELEKEARAQEDYFQFQFDELEKVDLSSEQHEQDESDLQLLENAEEIKRAFYESSAGLSEGEGNALERLREVKQLLGEIKEFGDKPAELFERLNSSLIELEDVAQELANESENVDLDPERLEVIRERMDEVNRLMHKHNVQSVSELDELKSDLSEKLEKMGSLSDEIEELTNKIQQNENELWESAKQISKSRKDALKPLAQKVEELLRKLGMEKAEFEIDCQIQDSLGQKGIDELSFLFSANAGMPKREISKAASGGELSRLMLALKYILSQHKNLPTIIFDEIDTGVSGKIAGMLGKMLRDLAGNMQVFAITHLPQVAGQGNQHYRVFKYEEGGLTKSQLKLLDENDRVDEIASMLSGEERGEAAVQNARELLK